MQTNRIARFQWQDPTESSVAVAAPEAFVACPACMMAMMGWTWQQEVFRMAYESAQANRAARARHADYINRLFSNWN